MCTALEIQPGSVGWDWYTGELTATLLDMGEYA